MIGSLLPVTGAETRIWRSTSRPGADSVIGLTEKTGVDALALEFVMFSPYLALGPVDWKNRTFSLTWRRGEPDGRARKTRDNGRVPPTTISAPSTFSISRFIEDVCAVVPVAGRSLEVDQLPDGRTSLVFRVI